MAEAATRVKRSKEEIFIDKGETVTKKVIAALRELGDLAKRKGYNDAQVEAIFAAIEKEQVAAELKFKADAPEDDTGFTLAPAAPAA